MSNSNLFFGRAWQLNIIRNGATVLSFSNDQNDYRLVFDCHPYASLGYPSFLKIYIYNLDQNTMQLFKEGDTITLSVGYSLRGSGIIFSGQIYSFYGHRVATANDINYIFEVYSLAYLDAGSDNNIESVPHLFDLPQESIGQQAESIASYYGYTLDTKNSITSFLSAMTPPLKIMADNLDDALFKFYFGTKYSIILDSRNKSYNVVPAQPNANQKRLMLNSAISTSVKSKIDDNNGLVGYPNFDSLSYFIKFTMLIDYSLTFNSYVSVDLSNSTVDSLEQTLSQNIVVDSRIYRDFTIVHLSYQGDTRGIPWYQEVWAVSA